MGYVSTMEDQIDPNRRELFDLNKVKAPNTQPDKGRRIRGKTEPRVVDFDKVHAELEKLIDEELMMFHKDLQNYTHKALNRSKKRLKRRIGRMFLGPTRAIGPP